MLRPEIKKVASSHPAAQTGEITTVPFASNDYYTATVTTDIVMELGAAADTKDGPRDSEVRVKQEKKRSGTEMPGRRHRSPYH